MCGKSEWISHHDIGVFFNHTPVYIIHRLPATDDLRKIWVFKIRVPYRGLQEWTWNRAQSCGKPSVNRLQATTAQILRDT